MHVTVQHIVPILIHGLHRLVFKQC